MRHDQTLDELWRTAPEAAERFDPARVAGLPAAARRYLLHALAPGARLATAARLTMTGTIRFGACWCPFEAEQVLRWCHGFVWSARAKVNGVPVTGLDRLLDAQRWRILGLFAAPRAGGAEIARAVAGRVHLEAMWMPAALLGAEVRWTEHDPDERGSTIRAHGEAWELELELDQQGAVRGCRASRAGDRPPSVGGTASDERTVDGITIPTRHRVGWSYGTDRFEAEGEFLRCTLREIRFR